MDFRRPFYAKGRLKATWILYKTVAWALPTGNVCGNDGEWSEVFPVFAGKAHDTTSYRAERRASGGADCFGPLPSPLPRGEGISSVYRNDGKRYGGFHVFVGEAHATTFRRSERGVLGGFDYFCPLPNPLPRGEGTNGRESQQWSDFTLSPWEREQIAVNHNNS